MLSKKKAEAASEALLESGREERDQDSRLLLQFPELAGLPYSERNDTVKFAQRAGVAAYCSFRSRPELGGVADRVAWLGSVLSLSICVVACSVDPNSIHFIVPEGYRGPIAVVATPEFPEPEGYRSRADQYLLIVSQTGVVCIPSYTIFNGYLHTAEYADGSAIYQHGSLAPDSSSMRMSGFGSWGGKTNDHGVVWFGVGTEAEVAALEREFFSSTIHNRMPPGIAIDRFVEFERHRQYCE